MEISALDFKETKTINIDGKVFVVEELPEEVKQRIKLYDKTRQKLLNCFEKCTIYENSVENQKQVIYKILLDSNKNTDSDSK